MMYNLKRLNSRTSLYQYTFSNTDKKKPNQLRVVQIYQVKQSLGFSKKKSVQHHTYDYLVFELTYKINSLQFKFEIAIQQDKDKKKGAREAGTQSFFPRQI